jgi:hypothetical protein
LVPELYQILGTWILLFWIIAEHVPPVKIIFLTVHSKKNNS